LARRHPGRGRARGRQGVSDAEPELAALDWPELAIETDDIHAVHAELSARAPERLYPNLPQVQLRPWGALEFAMLDKTTVRVVFRQWPDED
jgi:hypothetical protein